MVSEGLEGLGDTSAPRIFTCTGSHVLTTPFPGAFGDIHQTPKASPSPPNPSRHQMMQPPNG